MIEILLLLVIGWMLMASSPSFAPRGGLVYQSEVIGDIALGTLAANTALIIASGQTSISATFLMKHIDYNIYLTNVVLDQGPFYIGLANGNATVTEITTAMNEVNTVGPTDVTQQLTQDNAWVVYQKAVRPMKPLSIEATAGNWYMQSFLGLGKGIPWPEGAGWQWFIYNADSSVLTTGATVKGRIRTQGVWLGA